MNNNEFYDKDGEIEIQDYMMWVGAVYYPTVDDFVKEAEERGVCKRISRPPRLLTLGHSRIFLLHDDGIKGSSFCFGYFVPTKLQYIIREGKDIPDVWLDRIEQYEPGSLGGEKARLCGQRRPGFYCVAESHSPKKFVLFDKPVVMKEFDPDIKRFRGIKKIDFGIDLMHAAPHQTMIPPSRRAMPKTKEPFSIEEDAMIINLRSKPGSLAAKATELGFELGRSKTQIVHRFGVLLKDKQK